MVVPQRKTVEKKVIVSKILKAYRKMAEGWQTVRKRKKRKCATWKYKFILKIAFNFSFCKRD